MRRDLAGVIRAAGNRDGAGLHYLMTVTESPEWITGALAGMLWARLGDDRDVVLAGLGAG